MKVLVLAPVFPPATEGGGPIRSLEALVAAAPADVDLRVVTAAREYTSRLPLAVDTDRWTPWGRAEVWYATLRGTGMPVAALRSARRWRPDVIYVNGFFEPRFSLLPQLLAAFGFWRGARRLVAPRGEFGAGALSRHPRRKRIVFAVYRMLRLHRRVTWHASSDEEAVHVRRLWGSRARVLVRENETVLPVAAAPPAPGGDALRLLFLARIVEHKGLTVVLEALARLSATAPVRLAVHGPVEDPRYLRRCFRLIEELPSHVVVTIGAALPRDRVAPALAGSDLLVLPTAGENFGHVVAEALAVSCPVMATPWTPWSDALRAGGGVVVADREVASWSAALEAYARLGPAGWLDRRRAAGAAYHAWRSLPKGDHVFDLLRRGPASETLG